MYQTWSDVYRNHNMIRVLTRSRKGTENPRVGGSIPSLGTRNQAVFFDRAVLLGPLDCLF